MKHNSLADFTDKVTSKELFNIYKKNQLCYNVWKGYCILFCITHAKLKKSAKIIMYYMRISDIFLQLAKGTLITLGAVAKGYLLPFGSFCMRNPRIACNVDYVLQYTLREIKSKYKNGDDI
jgi:hypothetical protein